MLVNSVTIELKLLTQWKNVMWLALSLFLNIHDIKDLTKNENKKLIFKWIVWSYTTRKNNHKMAGSRIRRDIINHQTIHPSFNVFLYFRFWYQVSQNEDTFASEEWWVLIKFYKLYNYYCHTEHGIEENINDFLLLFCKTYLLTRITIFD